MTGVKSILTVNTFDSDVEVDVTIVGRYHRPSHLTHVICQVEKKLYNGIIRRNVCTYNGFRENVDCWLLPYKRSHYIMGL